MRYRSTLGTVTVFILISAILLWVLGRALVLTQHAMSLPDFLTPRLAAWNFLLFSVAIGGITMILVQIVRVLVPVRGRFHRDVLLSWFEQGFSKTADFDSANSANLLTRLKKLIPGERFSPQKGVKEFERYSRETTLPSREYDLPEVYDLPIEQFCAQLGAAAELALERPTTSLNLLICVVGGGSADDDLLLWVASKLPVPEPKKPWSLDFPQGAFPDEADLDDSRDKPLVLAEAHATLARLIQRRIDGLQISAGMQWRRSLRWTVVSTSVGLGLLVSLSSLRSPGLGDVFSYTLYGGLGGLMAGFVAMLLRDLTAIVELRRRQL